MEEQSFALPPELSALSTLTETVTDCLSGDNERVRTAALLAAKYAFDAGTSGLALLVRSQTQGVIQGFDMRARLPLLLTNS
jgi:hypothetical protein